MSLPSQTCAYKVKITETSLVANAKIVSLKGKWQISFTYITKIYYFHVS